MLFTFQFCCSLSLELLADVLVANAVRVLKHRIMLDGERVMVLVFFFFFGLIVQTFRGAEKQKDSMHTYCGEYSNPCSVCQVQPGTGVTSGEVRKFWSAVDWQT